MGLPDPTQGSDHHQPGGWCYNLLPYIDQQAIHDIGIDIQDTNGTGQAAEERECGDDPVCDRDVYLPDPAGRRPLPIHE